MAIGGEDVRLRALRAVAAAENSRTAAADAGNGTQADLLGSVALFCDSLPHPHRDYAELGRAIHVVTHDRLNEWTGTDTPTVAIQRLLDRVKQADTLLAGLGVNLSTTSFSRAIAVHRSRGQIGPSYETWLRLEVAGLETQIVDRMMTGTTSHSGHWIMGKQAVAIARTMGFALSDTQLSKALKEEPPAFRWHKPSPQRLMIELTSFLAYLKAEGKKESGDPPEKEMEAIEERKAGAAQRNSHRRDLC
jgi:hypothetical protein